MTDNCKDIQIQYAELCSKVKLFKPFTVDFRKNLKVANGIKKEIIGLLEVLEDVVDWKIKVENMPSPFVEVYTKNGLPIPKRETLRIDLIKQHEEDCVAYRKCGLGMWAKDVLKFRPRLKRLSKETKEQIAKEIQEGAIPIFMPGRMVQYANVIETMTEKLIPKWRENGKNIKARGCFIFEVELLIKALRGIAKKRTEGIPEEPYLMLTRPTQRLELTSMNLNAQVAEIIKRNENRRNVNRMMEFSITPVEYAVLQKFFTMRASRNKEFKNLEPLDEKSFTRFVTLPLYSKVIGEYVVPSAQWYPTDGHLDFGEDTTEAYPSRGVRFVVRILL
jgi:hypothetical protein